MTVGYAKIGAHERVSVRNIGAYGVAVDGQHVGPGDIVECSGSDAVFLIGRGTFERCAPSPKPPASVPVIDAEIVEAEPVKKPVKPTPPPPPPKKA